MVIVPQKTVMPNPPDFSEDRSRAQVEGARIGIFACRPDGFLTACNPAFARALGFGSVDEALTADLPALHDVGADRDAFMSRVRSEGAVERARLPLRRRDGGFIHAMSSVTGVFEAGELVEVHGFVLDLRATSETIGRLAGGIAHDFNNLLTAILGYTELLLSTKPEGHPDRADLGEIQKAGQRAAALTQQLLAYGRKQVLLPKEVDLNRAVEEMTPMLARALREDVRLECRVSGEPAIVRIDPAQFEQVMLSLVLNARDAMPDGGEVRIEVSSVAVGELALPADYASRPSAFVRLQIADNGVGIPPEAQAHLFEPFFTTKDVGGGRGLGLASAHGIVRQSGGFISVASEPGRGSTFSIHFPAAGAQTTAPLVSQPAAATAASRGTILLVEDEDAVRVIVGAALRRHGFQVLEAATPLGACDVFDGHANDIALLLTDVVMPEMNGPALARRLTAARPSLRVLFISGYADVAPTDGTDPNVSFLSKPFEASKLVSRVSELLAASGPTR